jgi:hypothetical protein
MINALKRTVTADQDGAIHLTETALRPGTRVEVIVLIPADAPDAEAQAPRNFLETLGELSRIAPPMPPDFSERFEEYLYPAAGERQDG